MALVHHHPVFINLAGMQYMLEELSPEAFRHPNPFFVVILAFGCLRDHLANIIKNSPSLCQPYLHCLAGADPQLLRLLLCSCLLLLLLSCIACEVLERYHVGQKLKRVLAGSLLRMQILAGSLICRWKMVRMASNRNGNDSLGLAWLGLNWLT